MKSYLPSDRRFPFSLLAALAVPGVLVSGCGDEIHNDYHYYSSGDAGEGGGESQAGAGSGAGGADAAGAGGADDGRDPTYPDAPLANVPVDELELDLFGTPGNRFYFAVTDAQRTAMNARRDQGGGAWGPHYQPGGNGSANWVDHLLVTAVDGRPRTADYGKVQVKVVGQSTYQTWDDAHIPNLNIDIDQFVKKQRIAGYEHLRFSNGQVGSIFRDRVAYDIYRALEYPAPLANYAWVSSNVWGPSISIPYILVERYKQAFCSRYEDAFGGGCVNMWEFVGDFGGDGGVGGPKGDGVADVALPGDPGEPGGGGNGMWENPAYCQLDRCEGSRARELEAILAETPPGEGFKVATADYVDWPAFHRFQCLSWVLATSDDPIHAGNNVVLVERTDGLFQYLPYSVDISLGFSDSSSVGLQGQNVLARGCQGDPACWQDTLDACETLIADFEAIKPRQLLLSVKEELEAEGMLRGGDDAHFAQIDNYLTNRLETLPGELEDYRAGKVCDDGMVDCGNGCVWPPCDTCLPPDKPLPADAGQGGASGVGEPGAGGAGECPLPEKYSVN